MFSITSSPTPLASLRQEPTFAGRHRLDEGRHARADDWWNSRHPYQIVNGSTVIFAPVKAPVEDDLADLRNRGANALFDMPLNEIHFRQASYRHDAEASNRCYMLGAWGSIFRLPEREARALLAAIDVNLIREKTLLKINS